MQTTVFDRRDDDILFSSKCAQRHLRPLSNFHVEAFVDVASGERWLHGEGLFQALKAEFARSYFEEKGAHAEAEAAARLAAALRGEASPVRCKALGSRRGPLQLQGPVLQAWDGGGSLEAMRRVVESKFHPVTGAAEARATLMATRPCRLFEYRGARGDRLWGVVASGDRQLKGRNLLGSLLMACRDDDDRL